MNLEGREIRQADRTWLNVKHAKLYSEGHCRLKTFNRGLSPRKEGVGGGSGRKIFSMSALL